MKSYTYEELQHLRSMVPGPKETIQVPDEFVDANPDKLFKQHKRRINSRYRSWFNGHAPEDRSAAMYELGHALVEAGIPRDHAAILLQSVKWNKFRGREDEVEQIYRCLADEDQTSPIERGTNPLETSLPLGIETLGHLLERPILPPTWLIEGIVTKGTFAMMAGRAKSYKSTLTMDMAVSIATNTPFLGHFPINLTRQGRVLLVQEENDEGLVKDRMIRILKGHGFEPSKVEVQDEHIYLTFGDDEVLENIHMLNNSGLTFGDEERLEELEEYIAGWQPDLVILDPLYLLIDGDVSSHNDVRELVRWVNRMKIEYECTILLVHHNKKDDPDSPKAAQEMMFGSSYLANAFDDAFLIRAREEDIRVERVFRRWKRPDFTVSFEMDEDDPDHYEVTVNEGKKRSPLLDLLRSRKDGMTLAELADELRITKQSAQQQAARAKCRKRTVHTGKKGRPEVRIFAPPNE